jgi:hypothetical protein
MPRLLALIAAALLLAACGLEQTMIEQSEDNLRRERNAEFTECLRRTGNIEKCRPVALRLSIDPTDAAFDQEFRLHE